MSRKSTVFDPTVIDLSSCVPACKTEDLHPNLVELIRRAQHLAGFTFTITCGYRSEALDRTKGRSGKSSHCRTSNGKPCSLAVDVSTRDSHTRYKVLVSLACVGVPRLGVGKSFVHADIDETKPHPIIFHYYD